MSKVKSNKLRAAFMAGTIGLGLIGGATVTSLPFWAESGAAIAQTSPASFADVVEKVKPAVVSVKVKSRSPRDGSFRRFGRSRPDGPGFDFDFFFRGTPDRFQDELRDRFSRRRDRNRSREREEQRRGPERVSSIGSGFIISEDGLMVTNNHVIDGGEGFEVVLDDGRELPAKLIGRDEKTDLAVLKIESKEKLPFVKFSQGENRVGDWVLVVGNPFGLGGTVTAGIISARGRDINSSIYDDFIQIDAPINRGNSGGPAFNLDGEVVGVPTAIISPGGGSVGIGFAIPAATAEHIVGELSDKGSISRGWLGVHIQSVDENLAEALGLERPYGALVGQIFEGTPAVEAGIKVGDVILSVNKKEVADSKDLARKIADLAPGEIAKLEVRRDGENMVLDVALGQQDPKLDLASLSPDEDEAAPDSADQNLESYGLILKPLEKAEDSEGLTIEEVVPDSLAEASKLRSGDVLLAIIDQPLESQDDLASAIAAAKDAGKPALLCRIRRGQSEVFIALKLEDKG